MKKTIFLLTLLCQLLSYSQIRPFITKWQTTTADESITIPTATGSYDYTIDWGDGTIDTNQTGNATHVYSTAGIQTISISGDFPRLYFYNAGSLAGKDNDKLLTIEQWGDIEWVTMEYAFYGCENLNITNTNIDTPDLSNVTSTTHMFNGARAFNGDISNWDVSNIKNMSYMLRRTTSFNQPLYWDVSNVTNMTEMFRYASAFNQLLNWNVSSVTNMSYMFSDADVFNQPLNWDVSKVTDMSYMFSNADVFNQPLNWDVSSVTDMSYMFNGTIFNQLLDWNVSKVTDMTYLFANTSEFNQPLNWNTESVTDLTGMFRDTEVFNQDISNLDVSKVTDMSFMFYNASEFNQPLDWGDTSAVTTMARMFTNADMFNQPLNWDVSSVTNMSYMFADTALFNQPLDWDVSNVTDMSYMFSNTALFNQPLNWDVSSLTNISYIFRYTGAFNEVLNWDNTSAITNMSYVFHNAKEFNQPLDWDVSSVTTMYGMFWSAVKFNQPLNWNVSSVTNMYSMFRIASAFNQPLEWNVSNVTNMGSMFYSAGSFNQPLDWNVSNVTNMSAMFEYAISFNQPLDWDFSSVTTMTYMFYNASEFNQDIGNWDVSAVTTMSNMFTNVTLSEENYDALLKGWSMQTLQTGVPFNGGNSKYCAAETERQSIIDDFGWNITDGGNDTVVLDAILDVNEENSYILPVIEGTGLSGTEKYYTEIGGVRTEYEIGDILNYTDFTSYPVILYAYDVGGCDGTIIEESFNVTLTKRRITVTADALTKTYGDADPILSYTITSGSLVSGDVLTGSLVREAGETVGEYTINQGSLDNANYEITYESSVFTITKASQTINFDEVTHEDEDVFELTAVASSGLTITYTSSDTSIATISGNTITVLAPGNTIITAYQEGNNNFEAAEPVEQELNVGVLGVSENDILSSIISIGPNPSNNYIKIDLNTSEAVLIQVFNLGSKLVLNNKEYFSKELIDISHLREGVYLVRIITEKGSVTKKIIKT